MKTKPSNLLLPTEAYVKALMAERKGDLMIAHDFNHVNRVRNWALTIASGERFADLEIVELTSLLHDIGLSRMNGSERKEHGPVGADMAAEFLRGNSDLDEKDVGLIADAIKYHGLSPSIVAEHLGVLGDNGKLLEIIRDSDTMDALGAIGLMRALTSKSFLPEYDPENIKGDAWNLSPSEFKLKFGFDNKEALLPVNTIIDQINQQIRYQENLYTETAARFAIPLVEYMKHFVLQLDSEISHSIN